jgi:hypothetical protein
MGTYQRDPLGFGGVSGINGQALGHAAILLQCTDKAI